MQQRSLRLERRGAAAGAQVVRAAELAVVVGGRQEVVIRCGPVQKG